MKLLRPRSDRRTVESIRRRRRWQIPVGIASLAVAMTMLAVLVAYPDWALDLVGPNDLLDSLRNDPTFQIGRSLEGITALFALGGLALVFTGINLLGERRANRLLVECFDRLDAMGQLEADGSLRPQ